MKSQLLHSNYLFGEGLELDLYGEPADEFGGAVVTEIMLPGSNINLIELFTAKQTEDMGHWLDRQPKDEDEGCYERAALDRMMSKTDHLWRHP